MTQFEICLHPRFSEMFEWVIKRCGPSDEGKWRLVHLSYIEFKEERDALLFALTWL